MQFYIVRLCRCFKSYHTVCGDLCSRTALYCFPHIEQYRESAVASSHTTLWVATNGVRAMCNIVFV